ncbi:uncharacterized protein VTP21DRAFT_2615 [Calcarisporiella thermophila]|uniref:uncharacterized protein n=1 Tax=Calcarisporiella thermophila TaxID=911321 RepID=UPI003743026A
MGKKSKSKKSKIDNEDMGEKPLVHIPNDDEDTDSKRGLVGLKKWLFEYHQERPPASVLQSQVDAFMKKFTEDEYEKERKLAELHNQPDEDGFITVTRKSRRNTNTDGTVTVTAARPEEIKDLKPKKKELKDFYRFQIREAKRDQLVQLRKKFEEDKKRIESLKANRRFKPY